ncbi:hypothetical protein T459_34082 [Capsicum annuum]|uniref:NB-ARC domain-containing protein n=1 Tax=Capsicum annuum TaxID=4072 RepID=A0A2G2XXL7_CAPAN|nr:hypothetical protein T459_34082 [Capsicum annuum]
MHHSESSATMTEDQLVELLDALLVNLHYLPKVRAELLFPSMTQYELLQSDFGNLRDFHSLTVNGYIEHKAIEYVLPQFQLMAERVGHFYGLDHILEVSQVNSMLVHLLLKIIPVSLEVMHICSTILEASKTSASNIHVMIEFLLLFLTDMPKDFIHYEKLFVLLARVGALIREVSILIHNLEENSTDEENVNKISCASQDLLENIEFLKEDLRHVFLKVPADSSQLCFPMSDGPLFMTLLLRNLNDLLNSNAYSVALIKEEISRVKEDLEHIRSFFGKAQEKISKNTSITFAKSPNKPVENKSSIAGKIIVAPWELSSNKLTDVRTEIDVISIVGMPGLGKSTLAYIVYNDKSVVGHFDVRAWCTVDQERNEEKLLQKIFNEVSGLKERVSTVDIDDDVANKLRRQLFGKRYLIVLDDLWDTATWDELTRPLYTISSEFQKGSRVILTSRKKEVVLYGKCHSDPLYLRLLRPEESWELLEKKVFGEEHCADELKDVGEKIAQKCDGLPLVLDLIGGVISRKEKKRLCGLKFSII